VARTRTVVFSSFGVPIALTYPRDLEDHVEAILPPCRARAPRTAVPKRFGVERRGRSLLRVTEDGNVFLTEGEDPALLLDILDRCIRQHVSGEAEDHVFVHAGAVAVDGTCVVLPGPGLSGKSTLVAALVRAGATYLSDEYAVIDAGGKVVAYPRPISIRIPDTSKTTAVDAASLGAVAGQGALPVGLVALTEYRSGARWEPTRLSRGVGALRVFENCVSAVARPEESLDAIRRAVENALILEGPRGGADELAPHLIAAVREPST
jgi:hypothetical protein